MLIELVGGLEPLPLDRGEYRILFHLRRRAIDGLMPATAQEISGKCRIRMVRARQTLDSLVKKELVQTVSFSESDVVEILRKKTVTGFSLKSIQSCEWCGYKGPTMHRHHYPVKLSDGGGSVVRICPSCHCEFHHLTESIFYAALGVV
jgi:hypothetical protein